MACIPHLRYQPSRVFAVVNMASSVTFDDEALIWDELKINGAPIGEVLEQSKIVTWD